MKKLIITRGAPGAGKSTWIQKNKLHDYTLCPDELRLMYAAPVTEPDGRVHITTDRSVEEMVWGTLRQMLEYRLKNGYLTIIDATCSRLKDLKWYKELAKQYGYELIVVDFTKTPLETLLKQNKQRPEVKWVPEEAIENIYNRYRSQEKQIPDDINIVNPDEFTLQK